MDYALTCLQKPWRVRVHRLRSASKGRVPVVGGRVAAGLLLAALMPLFALLAAMGARVRRTAKLGAGGTHLSEMVFVWNNGREVPRLGSLAKLINILRGELAWVGPASRQPGELNLRLEAARRVSSVHPGLVSTWWVRQRTNIAYGDQLEADSEYVNTRSTKADLGILFRSVLACAYGKSRGEFAKQAEILGVQIDNLSMDEALDEITRPAASARQISFVNVDCVNLAHRDDTYRQVLASSDLSLGDGIGLRLAGSILHTELRQNVNGTDLFPRLCARMEQEGLRLFLLGGKPGVASEVTKWIAQRYPDLEVAGIQHGYFKPEEEAAIVDRINGSRTGVLLVAFGAPLQETWIHRHLPQLDVRSALGVGGLFDFYSGRTPRAPQWLREIGLEWTYRLYQEPKRMWRRYLVGNVVFLSRVVLARLRGQFATATPGSK